MLSHNYIMVIMAIGRANHFISLCLYGGHSKVVVTFHLFRYFTHLKVLTKAFMLLLFCDEKLLQWSTDARLETGGGFYRCATIVLWHSTVFGRATLERRSALVMCWVLWQYGLWSFQTGCTKLERFLPKNQHTQRKFLNFENWTNGEPQ